MRRVEAPPCAELSPPLAEEMAQARQGKSFYQWWNFIVFDAVTRDHFSIIYGVYTEVRRGA